MNDKLASIAAAACTDLAALIRDGEKRILEAWAACEEEARDNEAKPKMKLGFSITLDLEADKMQTELSFGVRHKLTHDQSIPDPNQPDLPMEHYSEPLEPMEQEGQ